MIHETIRLPGEDGSCARLVSYVPDNFEEIDLERRRPTVLICPGGAYLMCSEREGEPVALMLAAHGLNAFVLYYRTGYGCRPKPQEDVAHAMAYIREHAERYHVKQDAVAVMGFSAGGHLAASVSGLWHRGEIWQELGLSPEDVRPNAAVLSYPVIVSDEDAHRGSFVHLSGTEDVQAHAQYDVLRTVDAHFPPTFLWHTFTDDAVPVRNSLRMALALSHAGVMTEMHIFPQGRHGLSLANDITCEKADESLQRPECAVWPAMAARFLKSL